MDDLALQIGKRDHVVVDHAERADAGGGQIHQGRRAETAGADHQHGRLASARFRPGPPHLAQHDMAGVAFEFARHVSMMDYSFARCSRSSGEERGRARLLPHQADVLNCVDVNAFRRSTPALAGFVMRSVLSATLMVATMAGYAGRGAGPDDAAVHGRRQAEDR